jgi:nuclear GTP-binding protein
MYHEGTSGRIWGELYKVLDSSDGFIHVLDALSRFTPSPSRLARAQLTVSIECKPHKEHEVLKKLDGIPTTQ